MRFALVLLTCCVLGCGSGGPFDYQKVSGKIAYDDGTPIPVNSLRLRFTALDAPTVENATPRPAFAITDAQGVFECATSYKYGDGLIPGRHKVSIEREGLPEAKLPVTKEYLSANTSPITVDTASAPFDIKVPKPKARK